MIYCVWYPSGGFGHFVNAVLSLHGENFVRPTNTLEFSSTGNSHSLKLIAPKYLKDQDYNFNFLPDVKYSVLIDNGINNEGLKFRETFPTANIIKLCYTDYSWPVIAKTMINKAMRSTAETELDFSQWNTTETWAQREKYFLFLRDHNLRHQWRPSSCSTNINIETLLNYKEFKSAIIACGINLSSFRKLWNNWFTNNYRYVFPIRAAQAIIHSINNKKLIDLTSITDTWTQAVIYYYIWLEFGVEVPHNDFKDFFKNTKEIILWLNQ